LSLLTTSFEGEESHEEEGPGGGGFMITNSTLHNHNVGKDVLNVRDQSALKLGRLLLSTVLDQEDAANQDVLSRFFFDNWLKKSGGDFKRTDTFSIEMMSRVQKKMTDAKAMINASSSSSSSSSVNGGGGGGGREEEKKEEKEEGHEVGVSEGKENGGTPRSKHRHHHGDSGNNACNTHDEEEEGLPLDKRSIKVVGLVALDALDTCIAEFGQANPVLNDIRAGLLPLVFTAGQGDQLGLDDSESVVSHTEGGDRHRGQQGYSSYQTWLGDSHFMLESYQQCEREKAAEVAEVVRLNAALEHLESVLGRERATIEPLTASIAALEMEKADSLAMIEAERAHSAQQAELVALRDRRVAELQREVAAGLERECNKDDMVKQLTETVAQMERDKLPDIREEYAAALKDVERLHAENADLESAVRNQKIMLDMNKAADEQATQSLVAAETDHRYWQKAIASCSPPPSGEEETAVTATNTDSDSSLCEHSQKRRDELHSHNPDQQACILRRVRHNESSFFADTARAKTAARYVEYLEMQHEWAQEEIHENNNTLTGVRAELQAVRDNEQRIIDEYEAKLVEQARVYEEEADTFKATIAELEENVAQQAAQIQSLSEELQSTQKQLVEVKHAFAHAQAEVATLKDEIMQAQARIEELSGCVATLEQELKETREELQDTKLELEETIADLRETAGQLEQARADIVDNENQVGMLGQDAWMAERVVREQKVGAVLQGKLGHAQNEIVNLGERISFLKSEVDDLAGEVKELERAREEDAREFEIKTEGLRTNIMELEHSVGLLEADIEAKNDRIEHLIAEREHAMVSAEDVYASDVREADKLHGEVAQLTDERNGLVLDKRRLQSELVAMTERAEVAENHYMGSDELAMWLDGQVRKLLTSLDDMANNYNSEEFMDDDDIDPVVLKMDINNTLEKAKLLDDDIKAVAIDLMVHTDAGTKAFTEKFKSAIKELNNALAVSRKVIQTSGSIAGGSVTGSISITHTQNDDMGSVAGDASIVSGGAGVGGGGGNYASYGGGGGLVSPSGAMRGYDGEHLEIVPDGWKVFDPTEHALMLVEETPINTETMYMMREDRLRSLTKDVILDFMLQKKMQDKRDALAAQQAADLAEMVNDRDPEAAAREADEQNQQRIHILETAAAAVEREDPLRQRVKWMEDKMVALENEAHDLALETEEAVAEANSLRKLNEETEKKWKVACDERDDMLAKFEQAMKALHSEEEKNADPGAVQAREDAEKAKHPAMRNIKDIINANKGNPKKLVQPFVHFIRRNENEISRHLGTQSVMMREVRHMVERIKEAFSGIEEEESRFYYRKHNSKETDQENCGALNRVWDLVRRVTKDIDDQSKWVFETQDFRMGEDKIMAALGVPPGGSSTIDPMQAVGDNHLAAAYEVHLTGVKNNSNAEISDILEEAEGPGGDSLRAQLVSGMDALAASLRFKARQQGGWRMELFRLDGSVDLDMPIDDWTRDDKIFILDQKLQYARELLAKQGEQQKVLVDRLKNERAALEKEMDGLRDYMQLLQEEYGAVGIQHDFFVYKRVKEGILDGSLAKHNLGETIYNPADFTEIETAIFKTVQLLLSLSGCELDREGEESEESKLAAEGTDKGPVHLSVVHDSKTITPAGDRPPMVIDAAPHTRPSTTGGSRDGKHSANMIALATNKLQRSTYSVILLLLLALLFPMSLSVCLSLIYLLLPVCTL
jgi:chromosome segregation ATPase